MLICIIILCCFMRNKTMMMMMMIDECFTRDITELNVSWKPLTFLVLMSTEVRGVRRGGVFGVSEHPPQLRSRIFLSLHVTGEVLDELAKKPRRLPFRLA